MLWKFWKRNSKDPLAKVLFANYRLNLLTIPREKATVGDLYMSKGDTSQLSTPGSITNFLEPSLELPPVQLDDTMADQVSNIFSHDISASVGLEFLEGFLMALLGGSLVTKIRGNFQEKKTETLKLQFGSLSRDSLDVFDLGNRLKDHKLKSDSALYAKGRRYYVVCGVARSQSIVIIAQDDKGEKVDLDIQVINMVNETGAGSVQTSASKQIIFKGNKKLAFGVELYELKYDSREKRLILDMPTEGFRVRGPEPSYVGQEDSMFFELT
jgi:hypothetical protein